MRWRCLPGDGTWSGIDAVGFTILVKLWDSLGLAECRTPRASQPTVGNGDADRFKADWRLLMSRIHRSLGLVPASGCQ